MRGPSIRTRRALRVALTAITAVLVFFASAVPAWAMTLTFVRHGESEANAAGIIDTTVPGPPLTPTGFAQAAAVAEVLAANIPPYDGIYASSMLRAQQTAYALLDELGLSHDTLTVLPGLREISAGVWEGSSEDEGLGRLGYAIPPVLWTLGLRSVPILGSEDGNEFDARVDDAVQLIADNGDDNAVAFGHGATIMFWVMMNVDNPDPTLLLSHILDNTDIVVVEGSPEEGWTLVSWAGVPVSPDPSLAIKLFVDFRDLIVAPQTAWYDIGQAFATGDIETISDAIQKGLTDVATTTLEFIPKVIDDIVGSAGAPAPEPLVQPVTATTQMAPIADTPTPVSAKKNALDPNLITEAVTISEAAAPVTTGKANGATDLTDGNLVRPGEGAATSSQHDQGLQSAVKDVTDSVGDTPSGITRADSEATNANAGVGTPGGDSQQSAA